MKVFEFETPTVDRTGKIIQVTKRRLRYWTTSLAGDEGPILEMHAIQGGQLLMGSSDGHHQSLANRYANGAYCREVRVRAFCLSRYLITQLQWLAVANLPPVTRKTINPDPSHFKGGCLPVENVSWCDAIEFCARLSQYTGHPYRLPSEAEWEYACRAGSTTSFYFGETITSDLVNYNAGYTLAEELKGEYRARTTEVSCFPPNAFGLFDMLGNVSEWCADPIHFNHTEVPRSTDVWDAENDAEIYNDLVRNAGSLILDGRSRVIRGGSWASQPSACIIPFRFHEHPRRHNPTLGFRIASSIPIRG